jgi:hypothetical protein
MKNPICASCKEHQFTPVSKPADKQLCGFWLCHTCYEHAISQTGVTYRLYKLSESNIKSCHDVIWNLKRA